MVERSTCKDELTDGNRLTRPMLAMALIPTTLDGTVGVGSRLRTSWLVQPGRDFWAGVALADGPGIGATGGVGIDPRQQPSPHLSRCPLSRVNGAGSRA